jgi:hypothetical protein
MMEAENGIPGQVNQIKCSNMKLLDLEIATESGLLAGRADDLQNQAFYQRL